jgi:hypothetical protein
MICREVEELLPGYSAEALSRLQTLRVRRHLDGCATCAREWAKLGSALRLVERYGAVEPPFGLWEAVCREIEAGSSLPGEARVERREPRARTAGDRPSWWAGLFAPPAKARLAPAALAAAALAAVLWGLWPGGGRAPGILTERLPVLAQEPEMVAAVQQHSLASAGLFFGDRAGFESVVQMVRRHEEVP